ncbi:hypothetical protein POTOM_021555 [Populus tomentosa]|uniref:CSD domain-containing protein n=1 Tax=Populus tomentosa TaxID=118781 RepID=A0A8X8D115_POPTO|nr:hypothetical protein POTOM_021555 [Populus tomentosa]
MAETKRSTGNVKWFSAQKGFGFIAPDDGSEDLFVHQTSIQSDGFRTLSDGQPVEFSVDSGEDGRTKAIDVVGVSRSRRPRGGRGGGRGCYVGRGRGGGGFGRGGRSNGGGYEGGGYGGGGGGRACFNCGRSVTGLSWLVIFEEIPKLVACLACHLHSIKDTPWMIGVLFWAHWKSFWLCHVMLPVQFFYLSNQGQLDFYCHRKPQDHIKVFKMLRFYLPFSSLVLLKFELSELCTFIHMYFSSI